MLCPNINHVNTSLHHVDEKYPGTVTFLRGTCPPGYQEWTPEQVQSIA